MGWRENFQKIGGHPTFRDETGKRHGVVVVLRRADNDGHGNARWTCRCDDCGGEHLIIGTHLRSRPPQRCPEGKAKVKGGRACQ